jgi:hypothetical protein
MSAQTFVMRTRRDMRWALMGSNFPATRQKRPRLGRNRRKPPAAWLALSKMPGFLDFLPGKICRVAARIARSDPADRQIVPD